MPQHPGLMLRVNGQMVHFQLESVPSHSPGGVVGAHAGVSGPTTGNSGDSEGDLLSDFPGQEGSLFSSFPSPFLTISGLSFQCGFLQTSPLFLTPRVAHTVMPSFVLISCNFSTTS